MPDSTTAAPHTRTVQKLDACGLVLPAPAAPVASYVPAVRTANLIYTSGQLPLVSGTLAHRGKVGTDVSPDDAVDAARICTLNALAVIAALTDLDSIVRIVKVVGFVASASGFVEQPRVINGASDLLVSVFGEAGQHARSAVGVAELPLNAPVEVELIVEVS